MTWRRLDPKELDHELIWLGVSVASLVGAWVWFRLALPLPGCPFHAITGLPCPTCGMTRALRSSFHRDWQTAAGFNPLAFLSYAGVVVYDVYAAIVLAFRLPRLRWDKISPRAGWMVRCGAIAAILGNWAWLIWRRV